MSVDMTSTEDRGPQLTAVCLTFISLATVACALRTFVRIRLVKVFGIEDAFMVFAWLCFLMFVAAALGGIQWGTGRHYWNLTPEDMMMALRYWWVCYIGYTTTMISVKLSVGLTLLRLTVNPIHKRILYTIMSISVFTGTIFFFVTIFQCSPVPYFWNRALGDAGTCLNMSILEGITYAYSAVNTVTDFTFGLLPIFMIKGLNMDFKTKVMLIPILGMAGVASTAILVRMAYIREFADPDFLFATTDIAIWSCIEQGLAITAGSLATVRPLFLFISEKLGSSQSSSRSKPTPQPLAGAHKRISQPFGVVSFRTNETLDKYHRMDDLATGASTQSSQANLTSGKDVEQGGSWASVKTSHGEDANEQDTNDPRNGTLRIEKTVEIETRVEPAYD